MSSEFDSRGIILQPFSWQCAVHVRADEAPFVESRSLRFGAYARFPVDLFSHIQQHVSGVKFEMGISPELAKWASERSKEHEKTIGLMKLYEGNKDPHTGETGKPFVSGWFALTETYWDDVWMRIKTGGFSSCEMTLRVDGLELDSSLGGEDCWNPTKQQQLSILEADIRFLYDSPTTIRA